VLEFVRRFILNKLCWMSAFLDLDAGTLKTVPADPVTVARMLSLKVDFLMHEHDHVCNLYER